MKPVGLKLPFKSCYGYTSAALLKQFKLRCMAPHRYLLDADILRKDETPSVPMKWRSAGGRGTKLCVNCVMATSVQLARCGESCGRSLCDKSCGRSLCESTCGASCAD